MVIKKNKKSSRLDVYNSVSPKRPFLFSIWNADIPVSIMLDGFQRFFLQGYDKIKVCSEIIKKEFQKNSGGILNQEPQIRYSEETPRELQGNSEGTLRELRRKSEGYSCLELLNPKDFSVLTNSYIFYSREIGLSIFRKQSSSVKSETFIFIHA